MKTAPTSRIDWPPPYKDANEKYSSQVQLSKDHRSLIGYVAGQPFPLIDANDPYVATKVVWNALWRPINTDDYDLRYFDCDTGYTGGRNKPYFKSGTIRRGTTPVMTLVGGRGVDHLEYKYQFSESTMVVLAWSPTPGVRMAPAVYPMAAPRPRDG